MPNHKIQSTVAILMDSGASVGIMTPESTPNLNARYRAALDQKCDHIAIDTIDKDEISTAFFNIMAIAMFNVRPYVDTPVVKPIHPGIIRM